MKEKLQKFSLVKSIWTEDDFDSMSWHDSYIYAMTLFENNELLFDIDYIFQWVQPTGERNYFNFWVSPNTLVFENVYDLKIDIEVSEPFKIEINEIQQDNPQRPKNADFIKRDIEYNWTIETQQGCITFKSIGYKQFVRQSPVLVNQHYLGLEKRKGISFDRIMKHESNEEI